MKAMPGMMQELLKVSPQFETQKGDKWDLLFRIFNIYIAFKIVRFYK